MKKFIARFLVLTLCALLGIGVFATEPEPSLPLDTTITDESSFDDLIEGVTNSTFWTTTGTVIIAVIGCVATVIKKVGGISELVAKKADTKTVNDYLKRTSTELSEVFNARIDNVESRLNDTDSNEKILITILTIFMTNANINPNAKAEIMKYLAGIKDVNASVSEMVDTANKIIQEANEAEVKEPTPALDSIVKEETESKMVLG
jgi:hypothetical protein